jgi:uncharacterized protein YbjT (DUF2867 family)
MKIVVIGGTGLIGSRLVSILRSKGHEVLAASPDSGVNTITGEGLDAALAGAQVVVDVARPPGRTFSPRNSAPASGITSRCRSSAPIVCPTVRTCAPR